MQCENKYCTHDRKIESFFFFYNRDVLDNVAKVCKTILKNRKHLLVLLVFHLAYQMHDKKQNEVAVGLLCLC